MSEAARLLPFPGEQLWISEGRGLGERERSAHSLMWDIGDWWNRGEAYGARAQTVTAGDWTGPKHGTCRNAGSVARRWEVSLRNDALEFDHYRHVSVIKSDAEALSLLRWCLDVDPPRSTEQLRTEIKRRRRDDREIGLAEKTIGSGLYGVIYADPPWRFEPYSRETGLDRAADNHYPTMTLDDIKALPVPAANDCVLFLWATVPMLTEARDLMAAWGFAYKSHCVWLKDRIGTGYWFRNQHELLLVGTRGDVPAPAPGTQYCSVIEGKVGPHSAKPSAFAEMIEDMFPGVPSLEMFGRAPRLGWDVWGNEAAE